MAMSIYAFLKRAPLLWRYAESFRPQFPGSATYWDSRYADGGTSGAGSAGELAHHKADVVNGIVDREQVKTVIEFGCGDGSQLLLARYPRYTGLDVSPTIITKNIERFHDDPNKGFIQYDPKTFCDKARMLTAELTLSLDVIYHLVEDDVYKKYIRDLFNASSRLVIVYSPDHDELIPRTHVRHRNFTRDVAAAMTGWRLREHLPNKYPSAAFGDEKGSFAEWFIFSRD